MAQNSELVTSARRSAKQVIADLRKAKSPSKALIGRIEATVKVFRIAELPDDLRSFVGTVMAIFTEKGKRMPESVRQLADGYLALQVVPEPPKQEVHVAVVQRPAERQIVAPMLPQKVLVPGVPEEAKGTSEEDSHIAHLIDMITSALIANDQHQRFPVELIRREISLIFGSGSIPEINEGEWKAIADILDLGLVMHTHIVESDKRVIGGLFSAIPLEIGREYLLGRERSIFKSLVSEAQAAVRRENRRAEPWFIPQSLMAIRAFVALWQSASGEWNLTTHEKGLVQDFLDLTNKLSIKKIEDEIRIFVNVYHGTPVSRATRPNGAAHQRV